MRRTLLTCQPGALVGVATSKAGPWRGSVTLIAMGWGRCSHCLCPRHSPRRPELIPRELHRYLILASDEPRLLSHTLSTRGSDPSNGPDPLANGQSLAFPWIVACPSPSDVTPVLSSQERLRPVCAIVQDRRVEKAWDPYNPGAPATNQKTTSGEEGPNLLPSFRRRHRW